MRRILHVDDEPNILKVFSATLEDEPDLQITSVNSPGEAVTALRTERFDLIVSDVRFNGGPSGLEFLKKLRESGDWTPACVFTGMEQASFDLELKALGNFNCLTYLRKPLCGGKLRERIIDLLHVVSPKTRETVTGIEDAASRVQSAIAKGEAALEENGIAL